MLYSVLAFLAKSPRTILEETLTETTSYHENLNEALQSLVTFLADEEELPFPIAIDGADAWNVLDIATNTIF